jgi:AmpD protein
MDTLFQGGWWSQARKAPSPNFDARKSHLAVETLVIHNISLPPGEFGGPYVEDFFLNQLDASAHPYFKEIEDLKVSAHFLIRRTGEVVQFVSVDQRAWHAGVSHYQGRENFNDFSVGIELEGTDNLRYTEIQYANLARLCDDLKKYFRLDWQSELALVGHEAIAPQRKTDPGPAFDWARLRRDLENFA